MAFRTYDEARDLKAIERIWFECGWLENAGQAVGLKDFLAAGECLTATINGEAECAVHISPGSMCYLEEKLEMCGVTAVTTSRIARKQGFAQRLTAQQLARGAANGAQIAVLGMFEQGFYDRLGFGTGSYEHQFVFDPTTLIVDATSRPPARLDKSHWRDMHAAMMGRMAWHGTCSLYAPELVKAEAVFSEDGFGLGYYDGPELSHFFWGESRGEHGPYRVLFIAYRNTDELLELFALIKSLGDQVFTVSMQEPPHVQMQDMLKEPFRHRGSTEASAFANSHTSVAYWQLRVLDLGTCVGKRNWMGPEVRFNLVLTDPLSEMLEGDWQGVGGEYVVSIGTPSAVSQGQDPGLPALHAGVGAFTRMLFGIVSASKLSVTDDLSGPAALLAQLDEAFLLPIARTMWDF
ncbi:MAG: GNAT family N-acetyltransferase [Gammaproteobacteria bacterium]|nr:GNAT family N-acetyltransferase [Gammaproteobacteria bacterium]